MEQNIAVFCYLVNYIYLCLNYLWDIFGMIIKQKQLTTFERKICI